MKNCYSVLQFDCSNAVFARKIGAMVFDKSVDVLSVNAVDKIVVVKTKHVYNQDLVDDSTMIVLSSVCPS